MNRKDFLQKLGLSSAAIMATYCLGGLTACSGNEPTPNGETVDFSIDLADPSNAPLLTNGGFIYQSNVIIARTNQGDFVALSRICTHEGYTIEFQSNDNTFLCPLHGSRFGANGQLVNGPALTALQQYNTELNGNILRIYSYVD
jgi:cytochrome b6-f complex iron-sulfur subunit